MCRILVDKFECPSGMPEALAALGVEVAVEKLESGDYDLGLGVLVERKTVVDLHLSLGRGRFWRQIGELRRSARLPYLLIEGPKLDIGSMSPEAIRGACLAVMGQGIPVLRSHDVHESAQWLRLLAARVSGTRPGRDRPTYAQRLKSPSEQTREAMLAAVPGISVIRSRALLAEFGSVKGVATAGRSAWLKVEGIGPALADALDGAFS